MQDGIVSARGQEPSWAPTFAIETLQLGMNTCWGRGDCSSSLSSMQPPEEEDNRSHNIDVVLERICNITLLVIATHLGIQKPSSRWD